MTMHQKIGHAPSVSKVAKEIYALDGPCIGCEGCRGLCAALIDTLTLPDLVLARKKA